MTDTLGKKFTASCSSSLCSLTANDPNVVAYSCSVGYGTDEFVVLWSRILTVHAMNVVSGSAVEFSSAEPAHPIACTTDTECTPWNATVSTTTYQFACLNGICQDPSLSLSINDVIALCQADIAWPSSCPYITSQPFASRLAAVGAACGSSKTCSTVPSDCKQPTPATAGIDAGTTASTASVDSGSG